MIQKEFADRATRIIMKNPDNLGLALGGSWITNEIDEFSDLDFVLVTKECISNNKEKMITVAKSFGTLLKAFTGEHIGEKRLLICLFDNPLLHVDIKYLTIPEFYERVENPLILWEKDSCLTNIINSTESRWPPFDYQWTEDRFWTWIHYAALKIGRGENFEAIEMLSFLRINVIAPMLQIKNGQLPRGVRKIEFNFPGRDINLLEKSIPAYSIESILHSLYNTISLYQELRVHLFQDKIIIATETECKVLEYLAEIKKRKLLNGKTS